MLKQRGVKRHQIGSKLFISGWKQWWGAARWEVDSTSPPSSVAAGYRLGHVAICKRVCFEASWERDTVMIEAQEADGENKYQVYCWCCYCTYVQVVCVLRRVKEGMSC